MVWYERNSYKLGWVDLVYPLLIFRPYEGKNIVENCKVKKRKREMPSAGEYAYNPSWGRQRYEDQLYTSTATLWAQGPQKEIKNQK